jgi:hypothetical protein
VIQRKAQRAMEVIMKSNRQPKQVKVKDLSTKPQNAVKGGLALNFTKITY